MRTPTIDKLPITSLDQTLGSLTKAAAQHVPATRHEVRRARRRGPDELRHLPRRADRLRAALDPNFDPNQFSVI
jgi:hypothetical protein